MIPQEITMKKTTNDDVPVEYAIKARQRNRRYQTSWRERANECARKHGYTSYVAMVGAITRGEVRFVKVK